MKRVYTVNDLPKTQFVLVWEYKNKVWSDTFKYKNGQFLKYNEFEESFDAADIGYILTFPAAVVNVNSIQDLEETEAQKKKREALEKLSFEEKELLGLI
jgi:hypothetical protein